MPGDLLGAPLNPRGTLHEAMQAGVRAFNYFEFGPVINPLSSDFYTAIDPDLFERQETGFIMGADKWGSRTQVVTRYPS